MALTATEQAKLNSLLAEGNKLAKDMGDAASLINLDKYKDDLVQTEALVKNLRTEWKEYTEDVNGTVSTFHRIVDEITKMSQGSKIAQSAFRKLTNIASELESHQLGLNNPRIKKIEKIKSKVTIQQNILKQSQKLIEDEIKNIKDVDALEGKELLNYQSLKALQISVNEEIKEGGNTIAKLNQQFDTQIAKTKQIEKTLGTTGALIKGISKIPIIGNLVNTNKALEEMEKVAKEGGGRFATMNAGLGSIGKDIFTHLTDPLTIGTGLISGLISGFKKIVELGFAADKEINSLSKSMGSSREQAASLRQHFVDIQNGSVKINSSLDINLQTTKNLVAAQLELADAFGTSLGFTDEQLADQVLLTKQMSFTGEEAKGLQQLALANKISATDVTNSVIKQTAALAKQTGIQFDNKKIIGEVAKVSGQLSANYKNDPTLIAKAVVQANKLGLTLTQAAEASSKLLDFESSIQNELEAELLTGKNLNLEKARLLALNGDAAGAAAEMLAQVGSLSEFQNMNVLQQEALAKAVGMTAGGLADSLRQQENLNKLGDDAKKQIEEKAELLRKNGDIEGANRLMNSIGSEKDAQDALAKISAQEKFTASMEKLKEILSSIVDGPGRMLVNAISSVVAFATRLAPIFKGLVVVLAPIADILTAMCLRTKDSAIHVAVKADIETGIYGKAKNNIMMTTSGGSARMMSAKQMMKKLTDLSCSARSTASSMPTNKPVTATTIPSSTVTTMPFKMSGKYSQAISRLKNEKTSAFKSIGVNRSLLGRMFAHASEEGLGARLCGCAKNLLRRSLFHNQSGIHKDHVVCGRSGEAHLVTDDHHGHAIVFELAHDFQYIANKFGIQCTCRFVE